MTPYAAGYDDRIKGHNPAYVRTAQGVRFVCYGSELDFIEPAPKFVAYAAEYVRGWEASETAVRVTP